MKTCCWMSWAKNLQSHTGFCILQQSVRMKIKRTSSRTANGPTKTWKEEIRFRCWIQKRKCMFFPKQWLLKGYYKTKTWFLCSLKHLLSIILKHSAVWVADNILKVGAGSFCFVLDKTSMVRTNLWRALSKNNIYPWLI